jgi:hypothetical protein
MAVMTAEEAAEWGKTLDFPTVWAAIMRTEANLNDLDKKIDRSAETVNKMGQKVDKTTENVNKMAEKIDRIGENVGGLNRSLGELIETLIAARLWEKFPGYDLKRAYQRIPIYDDKNEKRTDIDILLINTTMCIVVEVKRELDLDHIDEIKRHQRRMQLIRQYPPGLISPDLQMVGALAGGIVDPEAKDFAYESGFFVLELTGESVRLIQPPEGFEPKKW